ncbi:MAG: DUF342 domain-containing protein [Fibrobacter sp.]|nr:DUF342 domain-containing protein [Fibrobacter sp.]
MYEQIQALTHPEMFDKFTLVARATPAENGRDAEIKMCIALSHDVKPGLRADGSVDYRTIQTFVPVARDQVIAEKMPLTKGKPGLSVTGNEILPEPGRDLLMSGGKNTEISGDGRVLKSLKNGIVYIENGLLHVVELLHIKGNVDFSVGNIKYSGDVLVNGNIMPGFMVEAEGDIHIKGEVESARIISRGGAVIIEKGVIGKGDTYIKSKNGVQLLFAQESNISTDGVLSVEKYLLHCDCTCEKLDAAGANAVISGGIIRAEKEIVIRQAGADNGLQTKFALFDKRKIAIEEKIKNLYVLEEKLKAELEPIEKQLRTKAALLKMAGENISERMREEVKKWISAYTTLSQKIKFVQQNSEKCRQELKELKYTDGFIKVYLNMFPGCEIDLYGTNFTVNNIITNKKIYLSSDNCIELEG